MRHFTRTALQGNVELKPPGTPIIGFGERKLLTMVDQYLGDDGRQARRIERGALIVGILARQMAGGSIA